MGGAPPTPRPPASLCCCTEPCEGPAGVAAEAASGSLFWRCWKSSTWMEEGRDSEPVCCRTRALPPRAPGAGQSQAAGLRQACLPWSLFWAL